MKVLATLAGERGNDLSVAEGRCTNAVIRGP